MQELSHRTGQKILSSAVREYENTKIRNKQIGIKFFIFDFTNFYNKRVELNQSFPFV
jgi:hypothetical protein